MSAKDKEEARKSKASQRQKAGYGRCEEKYDSEMEAATRLPDPVAQILQLDRIRYEMLNDYYNNEKNNIEAAVNEAYPWGPRQKRIKSLLIVTGVGDLVYEDKHNNNKRTLRARLQEEARNHTDRLSKKAAHAGRMIQEIVEKHMPEILQSPLRQNVFEQPYLFERLVDKRIQEIAKSPLGKDIQDEPELLRRFAEVALRKGISLGQAEPASKSPAQNKPTLRKQSTGQRVLRVPQK